MKGLYASWAFGIIDLGQVVGRMNRIGSTEPRLYSARTMPDLESLRVDGGSEAHGINRLHSPLGYIPPSTFAATLAGPEGVAQPRPEARPMSHPILTHRLS